MIKISTKDFYFEGLSGGRTYAVREGGPGDRFIGYVTKLGRCWWRANLGNGVTAKGQNRSEAVLKELKKQGKGETA